MQSHLKALIAVFVMVVMDNVQGVHVNLRQPLHHILVPVHYLVVIQILGGDGAELGAHLLAADLVHAAVDGVEQALGQVGSGAEELHFLAYPHTGNAAGDGVIVAVGHPHQVVVLILDGGGLDGGLSAEALEIHGQSGGPEHGQVRLRGSAQVL